MKRLITYSGIIALVGFVLAGCSSSLDTSDTKNGVETDKQGPSMQLFSFKPEGQKAVTFGFSEESGWHLSRTENLQNLNLPTSEDLNMTPAPVVMQNNGSDIPGGDFPGGGSNGGTNQPGSGSGGGGIAGGLSDAASGGGEFSSSLGSTGFVASFGSGGFNGSLANTSVGSASLATTGFSGSIASGQCSLTPICDFAENLCRMGGSQVDGCDQIGQCRAALNQVDARVKGFLCLLSQFFACANQALNQGGVQGLQACATDKTKGLLDFTGGSGHGGPPGGNNNGGNPGGGTQDSDGDGIIDANDPAPNDPNEPIPGGGDSG
jgi:hypothetical protein